MSFRVIPLALDDRDCPGATVNVWFKQNTPIHIELEQLERLRSEDTHRRLMITHTIE